MLLVVLFALLFVVLFDTSGTLIGVTKKAGLMSTDGQIPNLGKALFADSTAAVAGSLLGTSSVTSYVESTAGVAAGGRTGLTAIVVGVLFLLQYLVKFLHVHQGVLSDAKYVWRQP